MGDGQVTRRIFGCHAAGGTDITTTFLRWTFARAVFHRGYVLASSLYFVVHARLSAAQLVFLGTVVAVTMALSDIPAGVWSDAFSRKWPLVIGHGLMAAGMVMTGMVSAYALILVTQVLWGLGWAFSSGADVAWLTDELGRSDRVSRVLTARARWDVIGGATGMALFGVLGWATSLGTAVRASGAAMAMLGLLVAALFTEDSFIPERVQRRKASMSIFGRGLALSRRDYEIMLVFAATMIVNGAAVITWLFPRRLVNLGFPGDLVLWYTALGIVSSACGGVALRIVEAHIDGVGVARRAYALTCSAGLLGLTILAFAPDALIGCAGVLLVSGIALNVTRAVSVVWVNRRTPSDVRATVHSFLSQAETIGKVAGSLALAGLAQASGMSAALLASGTLFALAAAAVARSQQILPSL